MQRLGRRSGIGAFSRGGIKGGVPSSSIKFLGRGVEDLAKPDVGTLADSTQGGANRHIRLAMHPTRPSLPDAMGISGRLSDPAEEKWDGQSAHRLAIAPESEHGPVSIMGPNGLYYANTVGASGAVSAGQNWDRLAIAFHRRDLKLVGAKEVFILLFSYDALFLAEGGIFDESF